MEIFYAIIPTLKQLSPMDKRIYKFYQKHQVNLGLRGYLRRPQILEWIHVPQTEKESFVLRAVCYSTIYGVAVLK